MITYKELIDNLIIPSFSKTVSEMSKETIEEKFGCEAAAMYGFDQKNPYHCYDLLMHSARTVDGIGPRGLSHEEFELLRIAAFYHDIGKPEVAFWNEKKKRQSFYGHAARSAVMTRVFLESTGMPVELIERVCFMIAHHDDLSNYRTREQLERSENKQFAVVTPERIINMIRKNNEKEQYKATIKDYQLLLQLCSADICAQTEIVWENGEIISARKDRLAVVNAVGNILDSLMLAA